MKMESGAYAGQDGGGIPPLHCLVIYLFSWNFMHNAQWNIK